MGMPKSATSLDAWFSHFRQRQDCGALDVVLLQETHVLEDEKTRMQCDYSRSWGFNDVTDGRVFSLWSQAPGRRSGVAILLNPYSAIQTLVPFMPQHWTAHWMAVLLDIHGAQVLIINCYAPTDKQGREAVFASLRDLTLTHDGPIFFGGDFTCTLHGIVDRSFGVAAASHESAGLRSLLTAWKMEDVLADEVMRTEDIKDLLTIRQRRHTYVYTLPGGALANSHLDRWYCAQEHDDWVRNVAQAVPAPYSNHNGVTIRVAPPDQVIQIKKPRRIYPVPTYAATQAASVDELFFVNVNQHLTDLKAMHQDDHVLAQATATWWDQAKHDLKLGYLKAKRRLKP